MNDEIFLIIDGNALLHRAWHAIPPLTSPDGVVVNAVYGFANILEKSIEKYQPTYLAVAWDLKEKTFRHKEYEAYKAQREKKEQELYDQIPMIQGLLTAYGIPSLSKEGFEADDILATLAKSYEKKAKIIILTGDADTMQLIDERISVHAFVKGISETKEYDAKAVKEKFGVTPEQMIDYKALMGDPSDNLPGVAGIGKKTAVELLNEFGHLPDIFKALKAGKIRASIAKKLEGQEEQAKEMHHLVELVKNVPLELTLDEAKRNSISSNEVKALYEKYGFRKLASKYDTEKKENASVPCSTRVYSSLKDLKHGPIFIGYSIPEQTLFGSVIGELVLFDGTGLLIFSSPTKETLAEILAFIEKVPCVIGHDLKMFMHIVGVFESPLFDVMVAAYLLSPGTRVFDLETIGRQYAKDFPLVSPVHAVLAIEKMYNPMKKELETEKMLDLFSHIEMPLIAILARMEEAGIMIDEQRLEKLSKEFEKELKILEKEIFSLSHREFNIASPSQLADVLFIDLKLPTKGIQKTKTGFSTAAPQLEKLFDEHPIIEKIQRYREFSKLKSTYVDALPLLVKNDGRIHTTYNQTIASTGRLSSSEPNLQNIPIRTDLGNEIRKAFIAPKGSVLVSIDYSQFELRLAAAMSGDKGFIEAFQKGADIHRVTAAAILGKSEDDITKAERQAAKAINFGILYGMGPRHLARSTGFPMEKAKEFIDRYFELHPAIGTYIESMKKKAREDGYVETLFGRRRYLPDIDSGIQMLVAAAERMAVNMPIQGTQADLVKMAMIEVSEWIEKHEFEIKILLQVHDELVFEVRDKDLEKVISPIKKIMEGIWRSEVPLLVDCEVGENWGVLEPWKKGE
ncbi:MAG: DNA polymerase I [Patescibacteria group bacterium]|jgi:DNA polymerase-1